MTKSTPLHLYKLPAALFEEASSNSQNLISVLTKFINDGYNSNKQFNIITSDRIKNEKVFRDDIGLKYPGNFILVLVKSKDSTLSSAELLDILKETPSDHIIPEEKDQSFNFNDISQKQILGTIGIKVVREGTKGTIEWELTGFVSSGKGVGKYLINKIEQVARENGVDSLLVSCIYEHKLDTYYAQFGFIQTMEKQLREIDHTGRVIGGDFEDDVFATQNFHVVYMRKDLS